VFEAHYEAVPDAEDHVLLRLEDGAWKPVAYFTMPAACHALGPAPATALSAPPPELGIDPFYSKYVDAGGIPIVASARATDRALLAARTIVLRMLRKRPDIRARLIAETAHLSVMAPTDETLDMPEYKELIGTPTDTPDVGWNERSRGLGGSLATPVAICGEENLLCMPCDRLRGGSILVHEFAHLIEQVGLAHDKAFRRGLEDAFANATAKKLFQAKYPSRDKHEYWAVGAGSWFETNSIGERRSRAELRAADPLLASLLVQVFPDDDWKPTCGAVEDPLVTSEEPAPPVDKPRACPKGMASLPGGYFPFGAATVVQPFCMDETEVTVQAYAACAHSGRCTPAGAKVNVSFLSPDENARLSAYCNGERADRNRHPANCVDWNQAKTYCQAQGKRLPTEQEWEWAARGGPMASAYPWGFAAPQDQLCWSGVGKRETTCEVGSFPAGDTPQGIHDLAGNVWEWAADDWENGNPVVKGSGFNADHASQVRASDRSGGPADFRAQIGGFRCVR
jgi:hypothetical protein